MSWSAQVVRSFFSATMRLGGCLPVVLTLTLGGCYVFRDQHVTPVGGHTHELRRGIELKVGVTTTQGNGYNGFTLWCRRDHRIQVEEQVEIRVDWARSFFKYEDDPPSPFTSMTNVGRGHGNHSTAEPDALEAILPLTNWEIVIPLALVRRYGPADMWYQAGPIRDGRVEVHFTVLVESEQFDLDFAFLLEEKQSISWLGNW